MHDANHEQKPENPHKYCIDQVCSQSYPEARQCFRGYCRWLYFHGQEQPTAITIFSGNSILRLAAGTGFIFRYIRGRAGSSYGSSGVTYRTVNQRITTFIAVVGTRLIFEITVWTVHAVN